MTEDFFDEDWNHLNIQRPNHLNSSAPIRRPNELLEMLSLADVLSKDIPFVRVDFYLIMGRIYFGELTFFAGARTARFIPDEWDITFGSWIQLPDIQK